MLFSRWSLSVTLVAAFSMLLSVLPVHAQIDAGTLLGIPSSTDSADVATSPPQPQPPPDGLASPRATLATFLDAMQGRERNQAARIDDAIETLDLSDVNKLVRRERGADLAWMLLEVIYRTRAVDLESIPDRQTGEAWLFDRYNRGHVRIARQEDGRWLFDRDTVRNLPAIHEEISRQPVKMGSEPASLEHVPLAVRIRASMPKSMRSTVLLLQNWQWLGLLVVAAAGVVIDTLVSLILRMALRARKRRNPDGALRDAPDNMLRPLGLAAMAGSWWVGINLLGLPENALLVLLVAVKFLASLAGVWTAYRLVDLVSAGLRERASRTSNKFDDVLAPMVTRTLKIFVTVIGLIFIADNLDIDVTGLIAGLGLGGLAFALAAKDMVQNLFGSATVLMDRTFTIGDWIKIDGHEGSVEKMGFRSTRVRTFYNSLVTIPNSHFITAEVDNMGKRRYRRYSSRFAIAYDTPPDRIEAFCEGIREIVRQHPYMRKDYYHVYLNDLGASALEVLVYVFWETPEWSTELRERHRFLLDCLRLAKRLEVEFAFPTQTLYLRRDNADAPGEDTPADVARAKGVDVARKIVEHSTGLGKRPPPVVID